MKDNTLGGELVKAAVIGGATTIEGPRKFRAITVVGDRYAHLTPDEAAFAEALVDHMARVDTAVRDDTQVGPVLYIDSTLAGNWGNGDHRYNHRPQQSDPARQPNMPWSAPYRVGMTAVNLYCARAFGALFDQISDSKQKSVLRLLDSIKLVFQDGSDAGVFFAITCQTMGEAKSSMAGARLRAQWQRTARALRIA